MNRFVYILNVAGIMPMKKKRYHKNRGICKAAKALGVDRSHLWRVIEGQRQSKSLLERYQQYLEEQVGGKTTKS